MAVSPNFSLAWGAAPAISVNFAVSCLFASNAGVTAVPYPCGAVHFSADVFWPRNGDVELRGRLLQYSRGFRCFVALMAVLLCIAGALGSTAAVAPRIRLVI